MTTTVSSTPDRTGDSAVQTAAEHLYDAECALHVAHQSQVDAWIAAANQKLHEAVAGYLAAAGAPGDPAAGGPRRRHHPNAARTLLHHRDRTSRRDSAAVSAAGR